LSKETKDLYIIFVFDEPSRAASKTRPITSSLLLIGAVVILFSL
jgi:hypothetical protein